ncbi:MAG: DUF1566 domain-containing protein [Acidithiobacillus sp.]|nr:DUF1566 domain-containing protein [Acidithiobacillus sp.]
MDELMKRVFDKKVPPSLDDLYELRERVNLGKVDVALFEDIYSIVEPIFMESDPEDRSWILDLLSWVSGKKTYLRIVNGELEWAYSRLLGANEYIIKVMYLYDMVRGENMDGYDVNVELDAQKNLARAHQILNDINQTQPSTPQGHEAEPRNEQAGRYLDNGDGTVTDTETGLQWMRCSLGQAWDGTSCVGEAEGYTWQEALDAAEELNRKGGYAGHRDWRLPSIEELHSLVYCSSGQQRALRFDACGKLIEISDERQDGFCLGRFQRPTIDLSAFPNTPDHSWFWSSSTDAYYSDCAWEVFFSNGHASLGGKSSKSRVRLVRAGQ